MATVESLITAEEFAEMHGIDEPCELIRGEIVVSPPPSFDHGAVCSAIAEVIGAYVRSKCLGRTLTNDSGVITQRGPDTVRGADVSYYSYAAVPKGERPYPYPKAPPELVFEVRSPSQSWPDVHAKVAEYLAAGVKVVCVADSPSQKVVVHYADKPSVTLSADDTLQLPEVLGDFSTPISVFFE